MATTIVRGVPMNDFRAQWADIGSDALGAMKRVGESGWYVLGKEVETFEHDLGAIHGVKHVIGCASGLDAIEIALRAAGIGAGDVVLTTPLTAFATILAVFRAGAVVCFADVDDRGLLNLSSVENKLRSSPNVRAVMPVHLYGQIADVEGLNRIAKAHGCVVIEDAAQAICGKQGVVPLGTTTVGAATSFYPTKNLGALGDGGALLTNLDEIARRARELRDYGQRSKYDHVSMGLNSRLDELHAAVLRSAMLPRLRDAIGRRAQIAGRYLAEIVNPAVSMLPSTTQSTWHLFPIFMSDPDARDAFCEHLVGAGVQCAVHYPKLATQQVALGDRMLAEYLPTAKRMAATEVSLPLHPYLTEDEVSFVIAVVNDWSNPQ